MNYWLFKSEPDVFSIDDLAACRNKTTYWDGVRNYQARNFLRDTIKKGDVVLFYHSNSDPLAIVGTCEVVKEGYPDFTAFDPESKYFDPGSSPDKTVWYMVDIRLKEKFKQPVTLAMLKAKPELKNMKLLQKGNRLSVMPVTPDEWKTILEMQNL